jgi:helix-turn-helix, Psq domain
VSHTSECREISWQPFPIQQRMMPQQIQVNKAQQEGRIELALQAYKDGQFQSLQRAANTFNICPRRLQRRYNGTLARADTRPSSQKLTATEEHTIVRYILDLNSRGFAPRLCEVADMADKLLAARGGKLVGKN